MLAHPQYEQMNCNLANVCDRVLPIISRELQVTFTAKCKGPTVTTVSCINNHVFNDHCKENLVRVYQYSHHLIPQIMLFENCPFQCMYEMQASNASNLKYFIF